MLLGIIIALVLLCIFVIAIIYHDTHNFVVRNYEIPTDKIDGSYKFVLLSDLHGYVFGKNNEKLIAAIENIDPDAILLGGDMFTAHKVNGKIQYESGFDLISKLSEKYKIYYGNGNHEKKLKTYTSEYGNFYDRYRSRLTKLGVTFLENDATYIENKNIRITGLDLNLEYFKKIFKKKMETDYISKQIGELRDSDKKVFQVLIAHNPQYFDEYVRWGADLTVSGHVHGGIVRLPFIGGVISPAIALFPKYDGGKFEKNGKTMILSRGLGTHTIHVRFLNPGEVCAINIVGIK